MNSRIVFLLAASYLVMALADYNVSSPTSQEPTMALYPPPIVSAAPTTVTQPASPTTMTPPATVVLPPPPAAMTPPANVVQSPPPTASPPGTVEQPPLAPPPFRSVIPVSECTPLCGERCKLSSRPNVCNRACNVCCNRCKCVPPGHYGNKEMCGACYENMTTHNNMTKCP